MAVSKRGPKRWLVRVYLGRNAAGKRCWHTETIHGTKADALRAERLKLGKRDTGRLVEHVRVGMEAYLQRWLKEAAQQQVRPRTFASYRQVVEAYVIPHIGTRRLARLSPLDVQSMVNELHGRGLSPRTIRYAVTVLRMALTQAVRWRLLPLNPIQTGDISLPKLSGKTVARALTVAEVGRLFAAAAGHRLEALWPVAVTSAMRPGEYLALKWNDVDFEAGQVTVRRTLLPGGTFGEPKTAKSRRTITLPVSTMHALREHKRRQAAEKLEAGPAYHDQRLVFCTATGEPLDWNNVVHYAFLPLLKAAELPRIRPYDLRHTGATLLLQAGENLKVVSERLGHASIVLTADVYSHVTPVMQAGAAERLEAALNG